MTRNERIQSLINDDHGDVYEESRCSILDLTKCFDLEFTCKNDCPDFCCDCCGDLSTTTSIENCIRIVLGTEKSNFFAIPGIDWELMQNVPLNSSGLRTVRNEFSNLLNEFNVNLNITYEDQQFCVNIEIPSELKTLCVRTFDGTIAQITETQGI